uniref:Uncharacterized protein n=1 Tax=Ananas comosus var. bracteatus TaxID=296719 RepID=A0A6V7NTE6_ANACO|nr:unnamed protein product [Ananas comosus var. bracteatus]
MSILTETADLETADNVTHAKKHLRLCIRCKAEMMKKNWETIVNAKKKGNEWNELIAFPEKWDDIPDGEDQEEEGSDEASNDIELEVKSVQCKQDMLMQKILHDYYNNRCGERQSRWDYQGRPFGTKPRILGYRPHWQHQTRPRPEPEFEGMTEGDIEFLGRRLVNELGIQPWPRPWERRKILKNHLRTVKVPANVPVDEWHEVEVKPSARWQGPMLMKTQKRGQQRMQAEARQYYEEAKGIRLNVWRCPDEQSYPFRPMRNDYEVGGSSPVPQMKSMIERPTETESEEKMSRRELEDK